MGVGKRFTRLGDVSIQECGGFRQNASRSVCWNSIGTHLASASCHDRLAKLWSFSDLGGAREITTLVGHNAGVERVRFHPHELNLICTSAEDKSIRLWDLRLSGPNRHCFAKIDLKSNKGFCAASMEWSPSRKSLFLAVSEKDDKVHVYDVRKIRSGTKRGGGLRAAPQGGSNQVPVRSFRLDPHTVQETHFSPTGTHLISAARRSNDGMGILSIYPWDCSSSSINHLGDCSDVTKNASVFVGHTGSIYTLRCAPNGQMLATGGNDALVGLWDLPSMVCKATISRRTKFIRSVTYSYDSKILACCSEEDGVDLADGETGAPLGTVSLHPKNSSRSAFPKSHGSDEIAFHPKSYVLACARGDAPVTIASLNMETE